MSGERVVVAMSGGVDSSVAAARLVGEGHDVIGISLRLARDGAGSCCSLDDFHDAAAVAERLGIPHYVFDFRTIFDRSVVQPFVEEYLAGRTPNPCTRCNQHVKFDVLWERAREIGATSLATGHYARIVTHPVTGRPALRAGIDAEKDQSYFLFMLDHHALGRIRFPVGALTKDVVRSEAARLGLAVAAKPESMDVCFVPDGDAGRFVERNVPPTALRPGTIEDGDGTVLGRHEGIHRYTVGQRRGLGLGGGPRRYVRRVDAVRGVVQVAEAAHPTVAGLRMRDVVWGQGEAPPPGARLGVRIRHRHRLLPVTVGDVETAAVSVTFDESGPAVSPGQAAVLYDDDLVVGGGWVEGEAA